MRDFESTDVYFHKYFQRDSPYLCSSVTACRKLMQYVQRRRKVKSLAASSHNERGPAHALDEVQPFLDEKEESETPCMNSSFANEAKTTSGYV